MEKNKKIIILLIGIVVFALIVGWIAWDIWGNKNATQTQNPATVVKEAAPVITQPTTQTPVVVADKQEQQTMQAQVLAKVFAEQFGTFSNHENYASLEKLKNMMPASTAKWFNDYIVDLKKKYGGEFATYYGVTTTAVNANVLEASDTKMTLLVDCQRKESMGAAPTIEYNQSLKLNLVKINNEWKIDGVFWQNKEA
ncbi:hypothetical protein HY932_00510 [Candidatus Falkowbacteria bacterium]|nr:hypothetical protein [Candidatus Falkowbacteria bacterium]